MLQARVERWWPDLVTGLIPLYGAQRAPLLAAELVGLASAAYVARSDRLHVRDIERMLRPDWLQDPAMVGYAAYTERFAGDLRGVTGHLPYLAELGVTYLHLMPLLRPREGDNDGGYAVARLPLGPPRPGDDGRPRGAGRVAARCGDEPRARPRAQPRGPRARMGSRARGPATRHTGSTSTSSRTARCPTPTS